MKLFSPRIMVYLWMAGFVGSFFIQTILQSWFAQNSFWGANFGWQNEIAIWNMGMFFVVLGILRAGMNLERHVLFGLFVLSACFGINHGIALLSSPHSLSNWMGFSLNMFGVVVYFGYLFVEKKSVQRSNI